jgi:glycosyltransferase involved in cell wall biosynthesis
MRIALVSRDVHPVSEGGMGSYITASATNLARFAEVTVITRDSHAARLAELRANDDPRLPPASVRFAFAPEVRQEEIGGYYGFWHAWSARVYEALREAYPEGGPDVVEFPDYHGEGCVTVQAKKTRDPALRQTRVCIRLHTSAEIVHVLDGYVEDDFDAEMEFELERYALRYADRILAAGSQVYPLYQRFYGADRLAPRFSCRHALRLDGAPGPSPARADPARVRFLYVGRLERRKGVGNLIRAVTSLPRDDWELTLVGADTRTAPLGTSMRAYLELMAAGDPRIRFRDPAGWEELRRLWAEHDVGVFPSLWECWPTVALEALSQGRPVIATPVGGLLDMVRPGQTGWLTRDPSPECLAEAIEHVLDHPDELADLTASAPLRRTAAELADPDALAAEYRALAEDADGGAWARPRTQPLVSVVIPYFQLEGYVGESIASAFEQTYRPLEVIVVNDGSLRPEDEVLDELSRRYAIVVVTQPNSGLGAARNFGIAQSRGRYVLPLDADNLIEPAFVERCVDVLEHDPDVAYVTSWSRYIDAEGNKIAGPEGGYHPIGNAARVLDRTNVAGDAVAVVRRSIFDRLGYSTELTSYEDWVLYRQLQAQGLIGHVIPEPLLLYRLREDSMLRLVGVPRKTRLAGEMRAYLKEREITWT